MEVTVVVRAAETDDLARDLLAWLDEANESWDAVRLAEKEPTRGTLGALADTVQIVIGSVGSASALALSIVSWLQYRKPEISINVRVGESRAAKEVQASGAQADQDAARSELAAWLLSALDAEEAGRGNQGDVD